MTPDRIKELRDTEYASDPHSQAHRLRLVECLDAIEQLQAELQDQIVRAAKAEREVSTAIREIQQLKAERDRLRAEIEDLYAADKETIATMTKITEENDRLRAALEGGK